MSGKSSATRLVVWDQLRQDYNIRLSRDTVRRLWRANKFPVPVRLGGHHLAWRAKDIEDYIRNLPSADSMPLVRSRGRKRKVSSRPSWAARSRCYCPTRSRDFAAVAMYSVRSDQDHQMTDAKPPYDVAISFLMADILSGDEGGGPIRKMGSLPSFQFDLPDTSGLFP